MSPIRGDTHLSGSLERSTGGGIREGRGGVGDGAAPISNLRIGMGLRVSTRDYLTQR